MLVEPIDAREVVPTLQDEVVGFHVVRWSFHERRVSGPQELDLQFLDDRLCDLVLHLEHIVHRTVVPLGPQVEPIIHVDKLRGYPESVARLADAAL